jgi:uncharacterized protein
MKFKGKLMLFVLKGKMLMRVVADTNVVVSGLLWSGIPRQILSLARQTKIELFTSEQLLAELEEVLGRDKFAERIALALSAPRTLVLQYANLAKIITPTTIASAVPADPDDNIVLACAVTVPVDAIVSGDGDLLTLRSYQAIPILTARELTAKLSQEGII